MNESPLPPVPPLSSEGAADRLDSWKDIAAYLKRDVSTVQRWEKREGMPVHRRLHDKLGSVYAFRRELDLWSQSRNLRREDDAGGDAIGSNNSTDERPPSLRGLAIDDAAGGARTEPEPSARASLPSRPASRWRYVWLTLGAAAVLAVGTVVWLLERADYFWQNPLADAQFRLVTDFGGTEQAAAISREQNSDIVMIDRPQR